GMAIAGCGSSNSSSTTPSPVPTATTQPPASTEPITSPAPTSAPSIAWASYNGSVLPDANTPAFILSDATTISTTILNNDGTVRFDTTPGGTASTAKADWRINNFFSATPSKVTLLFRMKYNAKGANNADATRAAEVDLHTGYNSASGARIKFIVRGDSNKLQIEKPLNTSDSTISEPSTDTSVYHIYQITYDIDAAKATATVSVYVDGTLVSNMSNVAVSGLVSTNNCLLIGDGGGSAYCCDIDWVAWTFDGAFTPTQVKGSLPSGLGVTTGY
ncbi:MAG TPA: hypothetical protein VEC37_10860, partial [Bacillota bacterium]|nr:hypothetical protein [Bacillota bacterium]